MSGVPVLGVPGHVYMVRALSGLRAEQTKVGFTTRDPIWRINKIVTESASPRVEIVCVMPGLIQLERHMHWLLRAYATGGEWFRLPADKLTTLRKRRPCLLRGYWEPTRPREAS